MSRQFRLVAVDLLYRMAVLIEGSLLLSVLRHLPVVRPARLSAMNKSSCLRDWTAHRNGGRVVRPRVSTCPAAEAVAVGRCGSNRNNRATVFPPAAGIHPATGSATHSQLILRIECGRVSRVSGLRNTV